MTLQFQKTISGSLATLPVAVFVALLLWVLLPAEAAPLPGDGLWSLVQLLGPTGLKVMGFVVALLAVYAMAELNNASLLLRISSRMLSSVLALLMGMAVSFHLFQPGSLLFLLVLLAYFPLFASYQAPRPSFAFLIGLCAAFASLLCPTLLWFLPVYWGLFIFLNAFTLRVWLASIIGVLVPYWFYGSVALASHLSPKLSSLLSTDLLDAFVAQVQSIVHAPELLGGWSAIPLPVWALFGFLVVLFLTGAVDLYLYRLRENYRTRLYLNVVVLHGWAVLAFLVLFPSLWRMFLPLFLVDAAMLYGHFFASTYTRFSHYYNLFLLLMALGVVAASAVL